MMTEVVLLGIASTYMYIIVLFQLFFQSDEFGGIGVLCIVVLAIKR